MRIKRKLIYISVWFIIVVAVIVYCTMNQQDTKGKKVDKNSSEGKMKESKDTTLSQYTIVIDAGHGGNDPGKVAVSGELEKDINLSIAKKLQKVMEEKGYTVIMTRTEDVCLAEESDKNKKMADLKSRIQIISEENPIAVISIHQNSFSDTSVSGAQVFYYEKSEKGKELAKVLQDTINKGIEEKNRRTEKANSNYYMLLHTNCPLVIVECGFLSNPEEAKKLKDEKYQEKMVLLIGDGIDRWRLEFVK